MVLISPHIYKEPFHYTNICSHHTRPFPPALQNFAEVGITRDNVAERWQLRKILRTSTREKPATMWLKLTPAKIFAGPGGEARDNVAEAVGPGSVLSTQSGWSKWRG